MCREYVELPAPAISRELGLWSCDEQLSVEELIPELSGERFRKAFLPIECNTYRPHSALQGRTPLEVLHQWKAA